MSLQDVQAAVGMRQEQIMTFEAEVQIGALTATTDNSQAQNASQSSVDIDCALPQNEDISICRTND
jgi:hypothetical protein